jgi:hypothetical protein
VTAIYVVGVYLPRTFGVLTDLLNVTCVNGKWAATIIANLRRQNGYFHLPLLGIDAGDVNQPHQRVLPGVWRARNLQWLGARGIGAAA